MYKIVKKLSGKDGKGGYCKDGKGGYCRGHYYQFKFTDPILDKIKKYWIIGVIIIALFGLLRVMNWV